MVIIYFALFATALSTLAADLGPVFKAVSADQSQSGNPAIHVLDANANSRWAAQGRGRWIQVEFKAARELVALGLGFSRGERDYPAVGRARPRCPVRAAGEPLIESRCGCRPKPANRPSRDLGRALGHRCELLAAAAGKLVEPQHDRPERPRT